MTNFQFLTDIQLESDLKAAVDEESKARIRVLHLLAEYERRRLYSKSFPSLFEYCVKELKYTGGAAQRRIDTMRAMKLIPEIESKLISGELNLMAVSQAQKFFRQEGKIGKQYSVEDKREVLLKLENKSTRDCVKELIAISPQSVPQERRRVITEDKTELKIVVDQKVITKFDKIKALLSHRKPHMTDSELVDELADMALTKLDPVLNIKKAKVKVNSDANAASLPALAVKSNSHFISRSLKRFIFQRDRFKCTHRGCHSNYFLEIDHIVPKALGGETNPENLRLLCRTHNQRAAIEIFGLEKMESYISKPIRPQK